jgi:hypothetical protein
VSAGSLKAIKGGKDTEEFESKTITLRGVANTRSARSTLPQYKQALKAAEDAEGAVQFGDLLTQLVLVAVTPSIAARSKPIPFPVYRTLEKRVECDALLGRPGRDAEAVGHRR